MNGTNQGSAAFASRLRAHVKTGRGVAPHWNDAGVRWIVVGLLRADLDLRSWRFGVGIRAWSFSVYIGPLRVTLGKPLWRWQVRPSATTGTLAGVAFQDYGCSFTFTTGGNS